MPNLSLSSIFKLLTLIQKEQIKLTVSIIKYIIGIIKAFWNYFNVLHIQFYKSFNLLCYYNTFLLICQDIFEKYFNKFYRNYLNNTFNLTLHPSR